MRKLLFVAAASAVCGLVAAGDTPRSKKFMFLYTVNNSGYVDVCGCKQKKVKQGSVSRRLTLLKTVRAEGKPLLLLDGGSTFFNIQNRTPKEFEREQLRTKAYVIVESMNRMAYDAMAMGSAFFVGWRRDSTCWRVRERPAGSALPPPALASTSPARQRLSDGWRSRCCWKTARSRCCGCSTTCAVDEIGL